jgi:MFS family permease
VEGRGAPLVGGQLLTLFGWRAIFWVLAGFGACALVTVKLKQETGARAPQSW